MSEEAHPNEGKVVGSDQSPEELAALSPPRAIEGELPQARRAFSNVSIEDAEAAFEEADAQADDREELAKEGASDE